MAKTHKLYYGGDERLAGANTRIRREAEGTDGRKHYWYDSDVSLGMYPAGDVDPDVNYGMAAENGGIKNQPYWRLIAPRSYFDGDQGPGQGLGFPFDTALFEYFKANPLEKGDIVQLAFVPIGYTAKWAALEVIKGAPGMVADLVWHKSDGTEEKLLDAHDFSKVERLAPVEIQDGDADGKSDNFLQLVIIDPPTDHNNFMFRLDYDVDGFDYMDT